MSGKINPPILVEQTEIIRLGDATRVLEEIYDAATAKCAMNMAATAEMYARRFKLGDEAVRYAAGIKIDAERRLGQYLSAAEMDTGGRPAKTRTELVQVSSASNQVRSKVSIPASSSRPTPQRGGKDAPSAPTLADLGISRKLSAQAQQLATIPAKKFEQIKSGEVRRTQVLREIKRAGLAQRVAALPTGTFRVIYADPPWKYGDDRGGLVDLPSGVKAESAAAAQYPPMEVDKICELGIRALAQRDAVLAMWATFPLLDDAMRVIPAWGFTYKTAFVWDKLRANVGNYHDASLELLLIAVRGSCPVEIDTRPKQIQAIARGRHSAKPEEFRALIDQLWPTGPRVELFRRGDAPAGWTTWGNEAT